MTREEAINYWEGLRKTFSSQLEKEEKYWGRMHLQTTIDAIDTALSALRQQDVTDTDVGKNEPLTLDELREAAETGDPVWLVRMEAGDGWVRIDGVYSITVGYSRFGDAETWSFRKASYGVRVFAYRQKPEEEDHA